MSIANDVCRRIDVVAETSDDEGVEFGVTRCQDVEPDDLGLREGRVPSYQDQHDVETADVNGIKLEGLKQPFMSGVIGLMCPDPKLHLFRQGLLCSEHYNSYYCILPNL